MARARFGPISNGSIITILDEVEADCLLQIVASHLRTAAKCNISALEMGYDSMELDDRALKVTQ